MILLPPLPQRAWLRSFWAALSFLAVALVGTLAWSHGSGFLWLAAAVGVGFGAGMIAPHRLVWPYRAWNKLARVYAGYAEALVLRISYVAVCVPAGWAESPIRIDRPALGRTLWLSREAQKPADERLPAQESGMKAGSWVARYAAWAWQSGETWKLALLPFLLLLFALQTSEQESIVPENIYTLF